MVVFLQVLFVVVTLTRHFENDKLLSAYNHARIVEPTVTAIPIQV